MRIATTIGEIAGEKAGALAGKTLAKVGFNVLTRIATGAATGAAVGSSIPIAGTIAGAVVGAVAIGLFSDKAYDFIEDCVSKAYDYLSGESARKKEVEEAKIAEELEKIYTTKIHQINDYVIRKNLFKKDISQKKNIKS